jgi:hypothetical protein
MICWEENINLYGMICLEEDINLYGVICSEEDINLYGDNHYWTLYMFHLNQISFNYHRQSGISK